MHRIKDFDVEALGRAYLSGKSLCDLADATGVCRQTLHRWLVGAGVAMRPFDPARPRRKRLVVSEEILSAMVAAWVAGASYAELNRRFGFGAETIGRLLGEAGAFDQRPARLRYDHAEIVRLRDRGWAYAQISAATGCSNQTIQRALSRAGRIRAHRAPPLPDLAELRRLHGQLGSIRRVAAKLGLSRSRVGQALRRGRAC